MKGDVDRIVLKPGDTVEKQGNICEGVLILCAGDVKANDYSCMERKSSCFPWIVAAVN